MDQKMYDKGLGVRKAVLGEAYVSNALKNVDSFNQPLQDLLNEYCWGGGVGPRGTAAQDPQHAQHRHDFDPQPPARIARAPQGRADQWRDAGRDSRNPAAGRDLWRHAGCRRQLSHRARSAFRIDKA